MMKIIIGIVIIVGIQQDIILIDEMLEPFKNLIDTLKTSINDIFKG